MCVREKWERERDHRELILDFFSICLPVEFAFVWYQFLFICCLVFCFPAGFLWVSHVLFLPILLFTIPVASWLPLGHFEKFSNALNQLSILITKSVYITLYCRLLQRPHYKKSNSPAKESWEWIIEGEWKELFSCSSSLVLHEK